MKNLAYLCLGSNIDPEENLTLGVQALREYGRVLSVSRVLETPPLGFKEQANFLNAVVLLETDLTAQAVWDEMIPAIEAARRRVRTDNKNAPRTLDIDLVLFNRDVLQVGRHRVPDADIYTRDFLAVLLAEVAPDALHPETGQTLQQIADGFQPAAFKPRPDVILIPDISEGD